MALCESSKRKMGEQKALQKIFAFISANTLGTGGANCKVLKQREPQQESGVRTNNFELLKHDRAYFACEKKEQR